MKTINEVIKELKGLNLLHVANAEQINEITDPRTNIIYKR